MQRRQQHQPCYGCRDHKKFFHGKPPFPTRSPRVTHAAGMRLVRRLKVCPLIRVIGTDSSVAYHTISPELDTTKFSARAGEGEPCSCTPGKSTVGCRL